MIFRRKPSGPPIRVDATIQGMIGARYLSVAESIKLPGGAQIRDLIGALKDAGKLDADACRALKGVRPPLVLLLNGDSLADKGREKRALADGDRVTILTPVAGG